MLCQHMHKVCREQSEGEGVAHEPPGTGGRQGKAGSCGQEKKGLLGESHRLAKAQRYDKAQGVCVPMSSTGVKDVLG